MTYADLIKALYGRSGMSIKDYAESIRHTTAHISNILNGHQPGSWKVVEACLRHAKLSPEDVLTLPEEPATKAEKELLRLYRSLSESGRATIVLVATEIAAAAPVARKRKT